jgi:hypothetical protein
MKHVEANDELGRYQVEIPGELQVYVFTWHNWWPIQDGQIVRDGWPQQS